MKTLAKTPRTFWELTTNRKVIIPIIQRDYAQGRQSRKIDEIRINFLETLRAALLDEGKNIELDFIYGSLDTNKQNFVPLDGQQRLTTLFLLHWYLAKKEGKVQKYKAQFLNFNYEVRAASTFFCRKLVEDKSMQIVQFTPLSEQIKNQTWFYRDWEQDPTVKGMLVMLDSLHQVFGAKQQLFDKLIDTVSPPISFKYLNLKDYTLTDSLYIKMNARGRGLTAFENFKAKLEQYLERLSPTLQDEFIHKVDGVWLDFFWKIRPSKTRVIDKAYLRFFKEMLLFFLATKKQSSPNYKKLMVELQVKGNYIPFGQYIEQGILTEEAIKQVFDILDFFSSRQDSSPQNRLLSELKEIIGKERVSTQKRILFFSSIYYILQVPEEIGGTNQEDWRRLMYNLAVNTPTSTERLTSAVKAIIKFDKKAVGNIYSYLEHNFKDEADFAMAIPFFDSYQLKEEWLKIKLINESRKNDPKQDWEVRILEAERHTYFAGQIMFLLDWCAYGKQYSIHNFEKYYKKSKLVFDNQAGIIRDSSFLFLRALFAIAPYQQYDSRRYRSFYQPRQREEWRRLLREQPTQSWIQELLDEMYINQPRKKLQEVIDNFNNKSDWRYAIIKYPELIQNRKRINIEKSSIRLLDVYGLTEYCTTINPFLYTIYKEWEGLPNMEVNYIEGEEQNNWESKVKLKIDKTKFEITSQYNFEKPDSLCFYIQVGAYTKQIKDINQVLNWKVWVEQFMP